MKDLSQNLKEEKCHPRPEIEWRCKGVRLAETKSLLGSGSGHPEGEVPQDEGLKSSPSHMWQEPDSGH